MPPRSTSDDEPPMKKYRVKYPIRARCPRYRTRVQTDNRVFIFILTSYCTGRDGLQRTFCFRTKGDVYARCYLSDPFKRVTLKRPEKKNLRFSYDRTPKRVWTVGSFFFFHRLRRPVSRDLNVHRCHTLEYPIGIR